ncbi:hypothetical protein CUZ88_1990 [Enterococcus xinjiangensis]|nr:hypothetical protein [Enterococcus lactis]MBL4992513.1 hypothetical protein [Enterococcus lactis]
MVDAELSVVVFFVELVQPVSTIKEMLSVIKENSSFFRIVFLSSF